MTKPVCKRVLCLDDDPAILRMYEKYFGQNVRFHAVSTTEDAFRVIRVQTDISIVTVDGHLMPDDIEGPDFVRIAKPRLPHGIFIGASSDREMSFLLERAGCQYSRTTKIDAAQLVLDLIHGRVKP